MKKFAQKLTAQGFIVLCTSLAPVSAVLLVFAFCVSDADPVQIYVTYTKMFEYIAASLLLAVGGGLLADWTFRRMK